MNLSKRSKCSLERKGSNCELNYGINQVITSIEINYLQF